MIFALRPFCTQNKKRAPLKDLKDLKTPQFSMRGDFNETLMRALFLCLDPQQRFKMTTSKG